MIAAGIRCRQDAGAPLTGAAKPENLQDLPDFASTQCEQENRYFAEQENK
jgi:hypothetical protein